MKPLYRIVQRNNELSTKTFVIQRHSWFKWRDVPSFCNVDDTTSISEHMSLIEAEHQLELLCFIPRKDIVVYRRPK